MKALIFLTLVGISVNAWAHQEDISWSEGEHLELGEQAAKKVCTEMNLPGTACPVNTLIPRGDQKVSFRYGEIVTSADYYQTPLEMYNDRKRGIKQIIVCAQRQRQVHDDQDRDDKTEYPSCNFPGIIAMPTYFEVVTHNYDHFGWNNMKAYVKYHTMALQKARQAFLKKTDSPATSRQLLQQALVYNGFADHYLTDSFASGHLRVPRIQIKNWAAANLPGFFKSLRGDLLTWLLHDRESISILTNKEVGLAVQNSMGDAWVTRGDSHLHQAGTPAYDPVKALPTQAVTESLREVLTTWQTGELPESHFRATFYVPFHKGMPMAQKFSAANYGMSQRQFLNAFYSDIPFFEKLIYRRADMEQMLSALPRIFAQFRKDIKADIDKSEELRRRLPVEYLDAYSKVQ